MGRIFCYNFHKIFTNFSNKFFERFFHRHIYCFCFFLLVFSLRSFVHTSKGDKHSDDRFILINSHKGMSRFVLHYLVTKRYTVFEEDRIKST